MSLPTTPAESPLRDLIAAAIYEHNNPGHQWADAHPDDRLAYGGDADAVLSILDPHGDTAAALARGHRCLLENHDKRLPDPAMLARVRAVLADPSALDWRQRLRAALDQPKEK